MPLSRIIGPGNEHDSKKLLELVEGLDGEPGQLYADAAYDTENIRRGLESMGIEPNIPVNPRNGRRPKTIQCWAIQEDEVRCREALRTDKIIQKNNHKV